MREIKFRAWHKNNNSMCQDVSASLLDRDYLEFMQFTGLKDKNKKEIYENDIVKFLDEVTIKEEGYCDRTSVVEKIGVVAWDNEELGYNVEVKNESEYHYLCCCEDIEVIGNIYKNKDLLV